MGCSSSNNRISDPVLLQKQKKMKVFNLETTPLTLKDKESSQSIPRLPSEQNLSLNLTLALPRPDQGLEAPRGQRRSTIARKPSIGNMFNIQKLSPISKPRRRPSITVYKNGPRTSKDSFISIKSLNETLKKSPLKMVKKNHKLNFLTRDTIIYPPNSTQFQARDKAPRFSVVSKKEVGNFEKYIINKFGFSPPQRRSLKGKEHDIIISSPIEDEDKRRKSLNSTLNVKTQPFLISEGPQAIRKRKNSQINPKKNSFLISSASKSQKTIPKGMLSPQNFNCDASLSYISLIGSREREEHSPNSKMGEDIGNVSLAMVFKERRKLLRQKHRRQSKNQLFRTEVKIREKTAPKPQGTPNVNFLPPQMFLGQENPGTRPEGRRSRTEVQNQDPTNTQQE